MVFNWFSLLRSSQWGGFLKDKREKAKGIESLISGLSLPSLHPCLASDSLFPSLFPLLSCLSCMTNELKDIYNFLQISDRIATSGQPTEEQLAAIATAGYKVIVNLALPNSPNALPDEAAVVQSLEMDYIHIPVLWEEPTLEKAQQFFDVMQANGGKKVFVHCAANMRVSAFMYLYRRLVEGVDATIAQRDLHQIWEPNERWQVFISNVLHVWEAGESAKS